MRVDCGSKRSNSSNNPESLFKHRHEQAAIVCLGHGKHGRYWMMGLFPEEPLSCKREGLQGMASFSVNCSPIWHKQMTSGPEWNLVKCLLCGSPMPWKMKHLPPEINFSLTDQTQCTVYVLCNRNFKAHKFLRESLVSEKIRYFDLK